LAAQSSGDATSPQGECDAPVASALTPQNSLTPEARQRGRRRRNISQGSTGWGEATDEPARGDARPTSYCGVWQN